MQRPPCTRLRCGRTVRQKRTNKHLLPLLTAALPTDVNRLLEELERLLVLAKLLQVECNIERLEFQGSAGRKWGRRQGGEACHGEPGVRRPCRRR